MMKKFNLKKFLIILCIVLAIIITISTSAYALYIRSNSFSGVVSSDEYYFESNLLTESGSTYELNSGTTKVSFEVYNYLDELRFSDEDIAVSVTTSKGNVDKTTLTLTGGSKDKEVITLSNLEDGQSYTVSVTGEAGFKKTLEATFVVRSSDKKIYKYIDTSNPAYILITVWSTNESGDVVISFDGANIVPDKTWPSLIDFNIESTSINLSVEKYSSYVYRFFVKSTTDLSKISVKYNGNEVEEKTPS